MTDTDTRLDPAATVVTGIELVFVGMMFAGMIALHGVVVGVAGLLSLMWLIGGYYFT